MNNSNIILRVRNAGLIIFEIELAGGSGILIATLCLAPRTNLCSFHLVGNEMVKRRFSSCKPPQVNKKKRDKIIPLVMFGWGTRTRTWTGGVRVRCPTIRRSPIQQGVYSNNPAQILTGFSGEKKRGPLPSFL